MYALPPTPAPSLLQGRLTPLPYSHNPTLPQRTRPRHSNLHHIQLPPPAQPLRLRAKDRAPRPLLHNPPLRAASHRAADGSHAAPAGAPQFYKVEYLQRQPGARVFCARVGGRHDTGWGCGGCGADVVGGGEGVEGAGGGGVCGWVCDVGCCLEGDGMAFSLFIVCRVYIGVVIIADMLPYSSCSASSSTACTTATCAPGSSS